MLIPLTKEERAYRRGCLQAIQFLMADCSGLTDAEKVKRIAEWEQALVKARGDESDMFLGRYLDVVKTCIER